MGSGKIDENVGEDVDSFWRRACSGCLLVIWIIAPYLLIQRATMRGDLGAIHWLEIGAFEKAIPVNLHSVWFYVSFYGLLVWAGLKVTFPYFLRYVTTIGWVALVSHACYMLHPTGVSRAGVDGSSHWLYSAVVGFDAPVNAAPSLHASLSVVAGLALWHGAALWSRLFIWGWVLGILWSTIALRQHLAIDLITGASLAIVCWWLSKKYSLKPYSLGA